MLKFIPTLFLPIFLLSCGSSNDKQNIISGIFRIESKSMVNPKIDTFYADQNQVKIYTDEFYAYTNLQDDSTASFGIGFYESKDNQVIEHNIYSTSVLDTTYTFNLKIEKSPVGYKQIIDKIKINGMDTKLVEQYVTIPAVGTSPLDGVWKLKSFCKISDQDTLYEERVQYKIFHRGYFMFVQDMHSIASPSKMRSGFGFGHFEFKSDQITETNLFSTYASIIDKQVILNINFNGDDEFYQVIPSDVENKKVIEVYERVNTSKK